MSCKGLHCDGCRGGGGPMILVVVVVLAVIAAAAWHVRHGIETGLEIAMWTIVGSAGLAAAGGLVYAGLRIRASVREHQAPAVIPARAEVIRLGVATVERDASPRGLRDASAAIGAPRRADWPLPGEWDKIQPRIGRDS